MSDSLRPHGLQHARLPCPSTTSRACPNSCPLSWWSHPTISSSAAPFSSCPQPFPASGSFPVSQLFASGGQRKHWSFSIHPSNDYSGLISFRINWLDLLAVQGTLRSLLQHHNSKASILWCWAFFMVQLSYPYMTTGKTIALTIKVRKWVIFLLINCPLKPVTSFWGVQRHQFFSALPSLQSSSHNLSLLDWQKQKNCQASE